MKRDWVRLGAELAAGRKRGDVTQVDMAARVGITRGPLQAIERGESKRVTSSIRAYAREIGWADGSVEAVLDGREPTLTDPLPEASTEGPDIPSTGVARYAPGMPKRIMFELSDGEILDTDVIDLSAPGSEAKLVLVAKAGASDASDEQKRADLLRWARIQRKLRAIVAEELSHP